MAEDGEEMGKEPHPCFNRCFFCSLSRQQALFHVLAAYSVYNTVRLFIPGFPKLHRFQAHHELILSKMLPKLKKHLLEDLREFFQEQLADSFLLPDDVVVEHLQASMSELRSKKLDQPPPGAAGFPFSLCS
ncbi:hypothetical protein XENOCAPTIV_017117 [Xenoophorus captivus]|uniref:Uncharacterized protein n=1 Tax=Xenoophorus captivus TaxID=1517983 RepID=A0ABV0QVQ4_9TELE